VPLSNANNEDLPAPLRPTRPTFSAGLSVTDVLSSNTLLPRRKVTFLRIIIEGRSSFSGTKTPAETDRDVIKDDGARSRTGSLPDGKMATTAKKEGAIVAAETQIRAPSWVRTRPTPLLLTG